MRHALLLCCAAALAAAEPHALFTDHAVLQQGVAIRVWGNGTEGEAVTVSLAGGTASTVVTGGAWMVRLPALPAGGPHVLTIAGATTVVRTDILIGEVWVCSGQSNMERQLGPRPPQPLVEDWEAEATTADLPAIRHFEVAHVASERPLAGVRGTWTVCTPESVKAFTAVGFFFARALHRSRQVPIGLLHTSWGGTPGEAWVSREALETDSHTRRILTDWRASCASFPDRLARWKADEPQTMARHQAAVAEAQRTGKKPPQAPRPPHDRATGCKTPSHLYNAMITPLLPYAMRGVLWYQGESNGLVWNPNNTAQVERARNYRNLLPVLISDWRARWGQGDFPFLFVQIPAYTYIAPELRESQLLTLARSSNTAMAVTIDVGDTDIHPPRKRPVGQRLALAARAVAYGEQIEWSGPLYRDCCSDGARMVVGFNHVGTGLVAKDGPLTGFTIAGNDKRFVPAQAVISNDTVVVWSDAVATPVAVRYGWAGMPTVNLYNQDGLPASPFRSDVE